MSNNKWIVVRHGERRHAREAITIEQALKDLAKAAKRGDLEFPFVLEFDGPSGAKYNISITTPEAAEEVSALGFMY
jgi:hypothetical protein